MAVLQRWLDGHETVCDVEGNTPGDVLVWFVTVTVLSLSKMLSKMNLLFVRYLICMMYYTVYHVIKKIKPKFSYLTALVFFHFDQLVLFVSFLMVNYPLALWSLSIKIRFSCNFWRDFVPTLYDGACYRLLNCNWMEINVILRFKFFQSYSNSLRLW